MKKYLLTCVVSVCLAHVALAQFTNQGAKVHIASGIVVTALDGVVNTASGMLTVDGTLRTPADLDNTSGATLQGDGQYYIGGNWTNDATFSTGTAIVTFDGDQNSTVTSGGYAFYNLSLNKTSANLLLADNMTNGNSLDFQAADNYVVLGDYNLQVADIIGYGATRHVRTTGAGFLVRTVDGAPVVFPVGNTSYNPVTLTNAGVSDLYRVRVAGNVLNNGYAGTAYTTNVVDRTWFIEETVPGGSDLSLQLQWNGSEELSGFDRTMSYMSHFEGGTWDSQAAGAAGGADPYTQSRTGITALSPFAILSGNFQPTVDILGRIIWKGDGMSGVKDAMVHASGDLNGVAATDINGNYSFTLGGNGDVSLAPVKHINLLNGVNVGDALAIQRHVVGLNPINDPYVQIAMDVNRSNSISTFDAALIRQALVGSPNALNIFNKSWRFVPTAYPLALPPWGFPEQIDLTGVNGNQVDQDFYGVKIGDVVTTFANPANFGAGMVPLVLHAQDQNLEAGQDLEVNFSADYVQNIAAWQFALQFDPEYLELQAVEPLTALPLNTDNFGLYGQQQGAIRAVWYHPDGYELPGGSELFRLRFKTLKSGAPLSAVLDLEETILPGLAFNSVLDPAPVELHYSAVTATGAPAETVQLFESWPNPFVHTTNVRFFLPETCAAQLRVLDDSGRELLRVNGDYPAGYNTEQLDLRDVRASGVLYCELVSPFGVWTKKMTKIGK
ncbi:MAG: hypothetical protein EP344_03010 [Bacteroidetes bacterium]|nr:MAG: hypothetical protein EP344_03010 [Bacteroidota bacterium]